jgi:large subunit ribosomal protein L23
MRNPHDIIIRPLVTEKAVNLAQEQNKYVFFVDRNANKIEIRNAIEEIFPVGRLRCGFLYFTLLGINI